MGKQKFLFYKLDSSSSQEVKFMDFNKDLNLEIHVWEANKSMFTYPNELAEALKNMRKRPKINLLYWRITTIFKRDYKIVFIKDSVKNQIVHFIVILPQSYRSSFLGKKDLILGPVWTDDRYRRKGILKTSIHFITTKYRIKDRSFWWVCDENNIESKKSIEKIGFDFVGNGEIKNNNLKLFSYFKITNSVRGDTE